MDPVLAGRIAAGVFAVGGLALLLVQPAAGAVMLVTGVGLFLLARQPRHEAGEPAIAHLVEELGLQGPGHHVPVAGGVRLFIPADPRGPYLMPDVSHGAVHKEPPASIGLAFVAPGQPYLRRWAEMDGLPVGQGPEEALRHLMRALPRLGLATRVDVATAGESMRIRMRLRDPAPALHAQDTGWHMKGGSPVQSFACGVAALALGRPVRIASSHTDADGAMTLEVVAGSTA